MQFVLPRGGSGEIRLEIFSSNRREIQTLQTLVTEGGEVERNEDNGD